MVVGGIFPVYLGCVATGVNGIELISFNKNIIDFLPVFFSGEIVERAYNACGVNLAVRINKVLRLEIFLEYLNGRRTFVGIEVACYYKWILSRSRFNDIRKKIHIANLQAVHVG